MTNKDILFDNRKIVYNTKTRKAIDKGTTINNPTPEEYERLLESEIETECKQNENKTPLEGYITQVVAHGTSWDIKLNITNGNPFEYQNTKTLLIKIENQDKELHGSLINFNKKTARIICEPRPGVNINIHQYLTITPLPNELFTERMLDLFREHRENPLIKQLFNPQEIPNIEPEEIPWLSALKNQEQIQAAEKALATPINGVSLIQGPPGTGKTLLISKIAYEIMQRGENLLIASHTHVAIDNALLKILQQGVEPKNVLRLASGYENVQPELDQISNSASEYRFNKHDITRFKMEEKNLFSCFYDRKQIVGMTLDSLTYCLEDTTIKPIYPFDWVIVDEASMNLLPKIVAARLAGKRVILVGDHQQLPPIVKTTKLNHTTPSYFEWLWHQREDLGVTLKRQFRSVPGIMDWSSQTFYNSELRNARPVKNHKIRLFRENIEKPFIWLDTAGLRETLQQYHQQSYINPGNIGVSIQTILQLLRKSKYREKDIAYISPFVPQTRLFKHLCSHPNVAPFDLNINAGTVDSFQGKEYPVVIYDLTTDKPARSHRSGQRLNVALTRARDLLIVIGKKNFAGSPDENPYFYSLQKTGKYQVFDLSRKSAEEIFPPLMEATANEYKYGEEYEIE